MTEEPQTPPSIPLRLGRILFALIFKIALPLVIIGAAVFGGKYLIDNTKKAERKKRPRLATLVSVSPLEKVNEEVIIEAMGTVIPSRELRLRPKVSGPIDSVSKLLEPGAHFKKDEILLSIEEKDFALMVTQRKQQLAIAASRVTEAERRLAFAERDLKIEKGRQAIARKDLEALGQEINPENEELVLRMPQLKAIEAELKAAKAAVEAAEAEEEVERSRLQEAELNLARIHVKAPYNMVIEEKFVDEGDRISTGTELLHLVGTDEYWVELSIPLRYLDWIIFPQDPQNPDAPGSKVTLTSSAWPVGRSRDGHVLRLLPQVDQEGRLAKVLVVVKDPLCLLDKNKDQQTLLANSFVQAQIHGKKIENVLRIPRQYIRNGNQIWLMNDKDQLSIEQIEVAYRARDFLYLSQGATDGDLLITSPLSTPVDGMKLRTANPSVTPDTTTQPASENQIRNAQSPASDQKDES